MAQKPLRIEGLVLTATGIRLPDGLALDRLEIEAADASIELETRTPSLPGGAAARAFLSAAGLQFAIQDRLPALISDLQISLEPGAIIMDCRVKFVFEIPIRARFGLRIVDASKLNIFLIDVDKGGPVPGLLSGQLDQVNPVFNATDLPVPFSLHAVEIGNDFVVVQGQLALADELPVGIDSSL